MKLHCSELTGWVVVFGLGVIVTSARGVMDDFDGDGYVGTSDYLYFETCFDLSGPGITPGFQECRDFFDADADGDVDLADFAIFQKAMGHLPIPLRDTFGSVIAVDSTSPYSGRQTCAGSCHAHDMSRITNGLHFQQGRTDTAGNLQMHDDIFNDGRYWQWSRGRYGRWVTGLELSRKHNETESELGISTFDWIQSCTACHPGGGPGEFDRDGQRLYDAATGKFGYEALGETPASVRFDGDYATLDFAESRARPAPWNVTGLSEPDCLFCHREDRVFVNGVVVNHDWRAATLAAADRLVNSAGDPVPAFAAAGTAGQGWFSNLQINGSAASVLDIDYSVGVSNGSLLEDAARGVSLSPSSLAHKPIDKMCARCHFQTINYAGVWFDPLDVHYRHFNHLDDKDPTNDIPPERSTACNYCHPGNIDHNFAKGNSPTRFWRDDLDWVNFRSCRECHLTQFPDGTPNPLKHPEAPDVPGNVMVHNIGFVVGDPGPMQVLSCEACHIPYGVMPYTAVFDSSVTASFGFIPASVFYSADPLDPSNPDKSRWYPGFVFKTDSDGQKRLFPAGLVPVVYWADWDQNGTPDDFTDDTIAPINTWRIKDVTGGVPLPIVTDDNQDGRPEINRPEEIYAYIQALKGNDRYGRQIAANPVLVKGKKVWYEDSTLPGQIGSFDFLGKGIAMEDWTPYIYGVDHNVRLRDQAWGTNADNPQLGCRDCHRPDTLDSPVFDRKILVDPYGPDGKPVYETVRQMTGLNPP